MAMTKEQALFEFALHMGDNSLILGQRLSEWCGHGPVLEQDIAITNIALDLIGQARSWLSLAGELEGAGRSEDDLAYLRHSHEFRNVLLVEQPNEDWAYTIVRQFLFDTFHHQIHQALSQSPFQPFAAIAEKSLKEVTYHLRYSSEWMIRLGDGTEISHEKIQTALDNFWIFTKELLEPSEAEEVLQKGKIIPVYQDLEKAVENYRLKILDEATLQMPKLPYMRGGGKKGVHSEYMSFILAEMQSVPRAYPGQKW